MSLIKGGGGYKIAVIILAAILIIVIVSTILNCIYYIMADNYVKRNNHPNMYDFRKPHHSCGCNRHVRFRL